MSIGSGNEITNTANIRPSAVKNCTKFDLELLKIVECLEDSYCTFTGKLLSLAIKSF